MSNRALDAAADAAPDLAEAIGEEIVLPQVAAAEACLELVAETIERLRPRVQADGGDMALVDVRGNIVRVRLSGACVACALAGQTLGGVRRELVRVLGNPAVRVLPAAEL